MNERFPSVEIDMTSVFTKMESDKKIAEQARQQAAAELQKQEDAKKAQETPKT